MPRFEVTCPEDLPPPPDFDYPSRRADGERDIPRRRFHHTPVTHEQLASAITRALADAERASLAAAAAAHQRGDIQQREVAPGSGVFSLAAGRRA